MYKSSSECELKQLLNNQKLNTNNNMRITVLPNGSKTGGRLIEVPSCYNELQSRIFLGFGLRKARLFTRNGAEIDSISVLRDEDVICAYCSDELINPPEVFQQMVYGPKLPIKSDSWLTLNVGGKHFTTTKTTLTAKEPSSMLARMFAEDPLTGDYKFAPSNVDETGAYLIDRNPTYFEPLLNYLRTGQLIYDSNVNPEGVLEEARFFGIESIVQMLEITVAESKIAFEEKPLTRRDVVNALMKCPCSSELRFQGVNLMGADLSRLDLRNINLKYANLRGCRLQGANLSWCCLERADLSHAFLDGAQLLGVKGLCANFESASMRNCNFNDPAGSRANMEGVNLKGADMEGSDMGSVNLRVATLKNANLQNCDLRDAVLAGADLECCDLSGSDLHKANLRGANLKDAMFELMLTPLHMAQTIR